MGQKNKFKDRLLIGIKLCEKYGNRYNDMLCDDSSRIPLKMKILSPRRFVRALEVTAL